MLFHCGFNCISLEANVKQYFQVHIWCLYIFFNEIFMTLSCESVQNKPLQNISFGLRNILSLGQSKPSRFRKSHLPFLKLLKFTLERDVRKRTVTKDTFVLKKLICITRLPLFSKDLILPSCETPSSPLYLQTPTPHSLVPDII